MRFLVQILVLLVFWISVPTVAHAECSTGIEDRSDNPNHPGCTGAYQGFDVRPVFWTGLTSDCPACSELVTAYNNAVRMRFELSYRIALIEEELRNVRDGGRQRQSAAPDTQIGRDGLGYIDSRSAADDLNRAMSAAEMDQQVKPLLQAQVDTLRQTITNLRLQITRCENQCTQEESGSGTTAGGGGSPGDSASPEMVSLPFPWQGPYPSVCHRCERLALRLNELPNLYYREKAGYDVASAKSAMADANLRRIRGTATDRSGDGVRDLVELYERVRERAEQTKARHERNLVEIRQNFTATLELYNDCVKQCRPQTSDKSACVVPGDKVAPIMIGPNDKYGTTAAFTNKVKETAAGAVGGFLSGLTGGTFSLGGGDDDKQAGPEIKSDPLSEGDFAHIKGAGFDVGVRAGFSDGNFIVSHKIFDSPDDNSTFHATWLVDSMGRKILPKRYLVFDIYVDHKLTVWWTYDHWTNGEHDYHAEGGWTEEWTEDLGKLKLIFEGEEGVKNSIWYQSGFDTAVKGVRSVAAVYENVDPDIFMGPCPVRTVTHLTRPSQTPVLSTVPMVADLFQGGERIDEDSPLMVLVKPRIIRDAQ